MKIEPFISYEIMIKINMRNLIVCIPRVNKNTTVQQVKDTFDLYKFGDISKISIIPGKRDNKAFVKYDTLNLQQNTREFCCVLEKKGEVKLFYNFPQFWKCYKSKQYI